jgi:hypothetical protein
MAITNQQNTSFLQGLFPAVGPNPTDEGGLFRLAADGSRNACMKVAGGEGGPDFVCTALVTAADTVNFDILFDSMLKKYAARQASFTTLVVRARVAVCATGAFVAANEAYYDVVAMFRDNAGTPTIIGAQVQDIVIEGTGAGQDASLSISGQSVRLAVQTLGATSKNVFAEVYVTHVQ